MHKFYSFSATRSCEGKNLRKMQTRKVEKSAGVALLMVSKYPLMLGLHLLLITNSCAAADDAEPRPGSRLQLFSAAELRQFRKHIMNAWIMNAISQIFFTFYVLLSFRMWTRAAGRRKSIWAMCHRNVSSMWTNWSLPIPNIQPMRIW